MRVAEIFFLFIKETFVASFSTCSNILVLTFSVDSFRVVLADSLKQNAMTDYNPLVAVINTIYSVHVFRFFEIMSPIRNIIIVLWSLLATFDIAICFISCWGSALIDDFSTAPTFPFLPIFALFLPIFWWMRSAFRPMTSQVYVFF